MQDFSLLNCTVNPSTIPQINRLRYSVSWMRFSSVSSALAKSYKRTLTSNYSSRKPATSLGASQPIRTRDGQPPLWLSSHPGSENWTLPNHHITGMWLLTPLLPSHYVNHIVKLNASNEASRYKNEPRLNFKVLIFTKSPYFKYGPPWK